VSGASRGGNPPLEVFPAAGAASDPLRPRSRNRRCGVWRSPGSKRHGSRAERRAPGAWGGERPLLLHPLRTEVPPDPHEQLDLLGALREVGIAKDQRRGTANLYAAPIHDPDGFAVDDQRDIRTQLAVAGNDLLQQAPVPGHGIVEHFNLHSRIVRRVFEITRRRWSIMPRWAPRPLLEVRRLLPSVARQRRLATPHRRRSTTLGSFA
jgi:hypothetical protein